MLAKITRHQLSTELLRGAPLRAKEPSEYVHVAILSDAEGVGAEQHRLESICALLQCASPKVGIKRHTTANRFINLVWEMHSEYVSYTVARTNLATSAQLDEVRDVLINDASAQIIAASQVCVHKAPPSTETRDALISRDLGPRACGGTVCDGKASIWTNFAINEKGLLPSSYLTTESPSVA